MKKAFFLPMLLFCLLGSAGCGETREEAAYYEIRVESRILEGAEQDQWLLGAQYYQGEPVSLVGELISTDGARTEMDVYLQPEGEERRLLMEGVSRDFRSAQWYLDSGGNCFIPQTDGVIRLDGEGRLLYHSRTDGVVEDICELGDGRIILLIKEGRSYRLAELAPITGVVSWIENVALGNGSQYIGASGDRLMLLDEAGFWHVDLKKGTRTLELPFEGTAYTLQGKAADFRTEGREAGIIWSSGMEEQLVRVNIGEEREIIVVRGMNFDYTHLNIKEMARRFNQSNDVYYVVIEECGEGVNVADYRTETNLKLASGKGADIIYGHALLGDVYSMVENGVFADLTPLMEASGMKEEDYFPAAFGWRHEGKIYGVDLIVSPHRYSMNKSLLGEGEEVTIEAVLDLMLSLEEKSLFSGWNERIILEHYLLPGSEDLWGIVDWEEGTCDFRGELFSKMLRAAKRCANDYPGIVEWRLTGDFYNYMTDAEMEEKNHIPAGILFDDGCHGAVYTQYMMGINAGSENIEGAWEFLAYLLGEEVQSEIPYGSDFSVNRKVFDKLAQEEIKAGAVSLYYDATGKGRLVFKGGKGGEDLTQEKVEDIKRCLEDVRPLPIRPKPIITIILEETEDYFSGLKSREEVIDVLQNRVQLYLNERGKKK